MAGLAGCWLCVAIVALKFCETTLCSLAKAQSRARGGTWPRNMIMHMAAISQGAM